MYLYTTSGGKLEGMQDCDNWSESEIEQLSEALKLRGRGLIVSGHGIVVCDSCRLILRRGKMFEGGIEHEPCPRCKKGAPVNRAPS